MGKAYMQNVKSFGNWTPQEGMLDTAELLLAAGTDSDVRSRDLRTPAHMAAHNDHASMLRRLARSGADVDAADEAGRTPLWKAAMQNAAEAIRVLVELGEGGQACHVLESWNSF